MLHDKILLGHGSGGQLSHDLIKNLFVKYFKNPVLDEQTDAAVLNCPAGSIAFTTDSFVVDPIFFPGGNIGKLAVCGTVNDVAVSGATPEYLSTSFIIEEGFSLEELEVIVKSMAEEAEKAGVKIVTGDTKVVNRGKCDKVFINTTGLGFLAEEYKHIGSGKEICAGDKIIINGSIGDHGMAIMGAREELNMQSSVVSDCACLNHMIKSALDVSDQIKFMSDATRGGLATVLAELAADHPFGIEVDENALVIHEGVRGFCELLGFDPMYVANEGKVVLVVGSDDADKVVETLRASEFGREATIIGQVVDAHHGRGWISTQVGGKRIIDMLSGEQLPRIC